MQSITINKIDTMDFHGKEAYKTLRTNIQFAGEDVKVISITSCLPNEGKSAVAMNLGISLAEAGKRVLLIDADMRKSILIGRYKIKNAMKGLSHYLSGQCTLEEVLSVSNMEKFHLITSGPMPPNPSELLNNKRFLRLLEEMRKVYDYIIIDCPPLGSVSDALITGRYSDGVALVVASEVISYKFAQKIKRQLENADCKILGVVLNKVDLKGRGYFGKYYGKYYGRYYGKYYGKYYGETYSNEE